MDSKNSMLIAGIVVVSVAVPLGIGLGRAAEKVRQQQVGVANNDIKETELTKITLTIDSGRTMFYDHYTIWPLRSDSFLIVAKDDEKSAIGCAQEFADALDALMMEGYEVKMNLPSEKLPRRALIVWAVKKGA